MKHPSQIEGCGVCRIASGEAEIEGGAIYEDDLWLIWHAPAPYGVAGWMTILSHRHTPGIAHFNDHEAARLGSDLRHFEKVLEEVSGALRIYTVSMNESSPHFHLHMVPKYETMAQDARFYAVFGLQAAAQRGEIQVDPAEVARITKAYRNALAANPPPRH